jgi:metal-responsive CopG/Arc/MetJ family transcriptional regulator
MKVAVSIPDDIFKETDKLARQMKTSRSHLYSRALMEFLSRHAPDQVTAAMNRVCDQLQEPPDQFVSTAARRILERTKW